MKNRQPSLGKLGAKFFALMQLRKQSVVSLGDLQTPLEISKNQEQLLFKRLAKNGLLVRLLRGKYLVPKIIPASGYWQPNENYVISQLMQHYNAEYYITGMAAFNYHGLTTQIPNTITIYNDKIYGMRKVGSQNFIFVKISPKRLGEKIAIVINEHQQVYYSSLPQTILDACYDWKRFGALLQAYQWLEKHIHDEKFLKKFINITKKHANVSTKRRIGYCLENFGIDEKMTKSIYNLLHATSGWTRLDPNAPPKGKTNKKWRIIHNANLTK